MSQASKKSNRPTSDLWARFRFSVVGSLLSSPPPRGELKTTIESLAEKTWTHPVSGHDIRFSAVTIERWYYQARREKQDPLGVLRRAVRKDCGKVSLSSQLAEHLLRQYREHQHWSYQLHYDNLAALVKSDDSLGPLRSYSTVRRYMQAHGLVRKRHGLSQAIQKRGLPRALMTDNGAAMIAEEVKEGLLRLGVLHEKTLPYAPYQNGKQESFWTSLEGRLMEMLDGVAKLRLDFLNEATQAWVEIEYNRAVHRETSCSPVERFSQAPDVLRSSPSSDALRQAFRLDTTRRQRKGDGTISLDAVRFEIPARFRHFNDVAVRYARWDLSRVDLIDQRSGTILAPLYPLDRSQNADGHRAVVEPASGDVPTDASQRHGNDELPPLLKRILDEYAAGGLPPAYLPKKPHPKKGEAS